MKKLFVLAILALTVSAGSLTFLESPYEFLDEVVMTFYKPLIWAILIAPLQNLACDTLTDPIVKMFASSNTLSSADQKTICLDGIKMIWENFYYGGPIGNKPYNFSWNWTQN